MRVVPTVYPTVFRKGRAAMALVIILNQLFFVFFPHRRAAIAVLQKKVNRIFVKPFFPAAVRFFLYKIVEKQRILECNTNTS